MNGVRLQVVDGIEVAGLEARRQWLADVQVARRLPREGLLWLVAGLTGPWVSVTPECMAWGRTLATEAGTAPLPASAQAALVSLWTSLWAKPAVVPGPAAGVVLLHYRGLLGARDADGTLAGLRAAAAAR